uniref:NADH dehydrogenase [ubiquinone] 1 beta subcomplex subunit 9 n=1 Tax=Acrobeloides nanus TaxID=290746 RepID=A0A914EEG2_9BILA
MESPAWMFTKALSHRQKVMRLYKRCLRFCEDWYGGDALEVRYQMVIMRARFDAHRDEQDSRKAQLLLADGFKQLWSKRHPQPSRFQFDLGGSAYDQDQLESRDTVLDMNYSFPEREQFPYYFNKRELRKKELLDHWAKIEKAWDDELSSIQTTLPEEKSTATTDKASAK